MLFRSDGKKNVDFIVYPAKNGDNMVGTAVEAKSMGFGGELKVLVGFDAEGKIYNYSLLAHTETPEMCIRDSYGGEYLFYVYVSCRKLAYPLPDTGHIVEQLAGEKPVFRRRDEGFYLRRSSGKQDGEVAFFNFPVFLVGTAVVRQRCV